MPIEWSNIRSFNKSQTSAFEELVCQLAREEDIPNRVQFTRVAAPDGGVEAYWVDQNGDEFAWQAKFFDVMGTSQWTQLTESVRQAIKTHPRLIKYYVSIPLDRQDPRRSEASWFMDKWLAHVKKWKAIAKSVGVEVEFEYWGSSELLHRLSLEKNSGRRKFWFGEIEFSDDWFRKQVRREISNLGERYTTDLNLQLAVSKNFNAIAQNAAFRKDVADRLGNLSQRIREFITRIEGQAFGPEIGSMLEASLQNLVSCLRPVMEGGIDRVDCSEIHSICGKIRDAVWPLRQTKSNFLIAADRLADTAFEFTEFIQGMRFSLFNKQLMVLVGDAGIGKSHLLGDYANRSVEDGQPCILLLGQHFRNDEAPWTQILNNILRLNCTEEDFLGALNARAEAQGVRILILIDAINEGKGFYFWPDHIRGFVSDFARYPWLGLVMSVRTSYFKALIPGEVAKGVNAGVVRHYGFSNNIRQATEAFFKHYNLNQPAISFLHKEYANPLFLKILCKGLVSANMDTLPAGFAGISSVIEFFLTGINRSLALPVRFNYSESRRLVQRVVEALVGHKINEGLRYIPYETAYQLVLEVTKGLAGNEGYLEALISEGVFSKNLYSKKNGGFEEGIYFAYERFEDHLAAKYVIDKTLSTRASGAKFDKLARYASKNLRWQGLLEALSIQLPEQHNVELYQIVDEIAASEVAVSESFVHSLMWRPVESIRANTIAYLNQVVLNTESGRDVFYQMLYSVALDPDHLFNAREFHRYMMQYSLAVRDSFWTVYLHTQDDESSTITHLINWARESREYGAIDKQPRLLGSIALSWILSTTNIALRDNATLSLSSLLENDLSVAVDLLRHFEGVNDPYIYERILAAVYGAALRAEVSEVLQDLATYVYTSIFEKDDVYPNVLVRDYARNIIEYAIATVGLVLKNSSFRPPYRSDFPSVLPSNGEVDQYYFDYQAPSFKDYFWSQIEIIDSMTTEYGRGIGRYGDFGRYTFQSAVDQWAEFDPQELSNWACLLIFGRFGYDVELHGNFDRKASSGDRHRNRTERIGKKYQWLALYEIVARLADNFKLADPSDWREKKKKVWFQGPWEPFLRNIDPTVDPLPRKASAQLAPYEWCDGKASYDLWDGDEAEWLVSSLSLPTPESIISVIDFGGVEWAALETHRTWSESLSASEVATDRRKQLWYQIRSYFVRAEERDNIVRWLDGKNFMGRWLPEGSSQYQIFAREHYWSPAYRFFDGDYYGRTQWHSLDKEGRKVGSIMSTTEIHRWEGHGTAKQTEFLCPREFMFAGMGLKVSSGIGEWRDSVGEVVCFDPSTYGDGPPNLLVRKDILVEFLRKNKIEIIWTVLGEKQIIRQISSSDSPVKWLEVSGVFYMSGARIDGKLRPVVTEAK